GQGLSSAELYDPVSDTWSFVGSLSVGVSSHRAVLLGNGKVLVIGGLTGGITGANATTGISSLFQ
ncbi:MAG: kelch motif-containing protein, partial [Thermoanaerobaculia bacterium]